MDQVEVKDVPNGSNTIHRSNFLSLLVRPSVVGYWNFIGLRARLADHGSNFNFHAKPATTKLHGLDHFPAKGFVAGFDIGHVTIRQNIA
jgi:hypothetical protein